MIWVLLVLAALPLIMAGLMLFLLRSGAIGRVRRGDTASRPSDRE